MNWIDLTSSEQFDRILKESSSEIAIFKHSTRCSISSAAKNRMEKNWEINNPTIPAYILDLLNNRDLSNQIAQELKVEHQSPQLLIIKDGECIYSASHLSISPKDTALIIKS